MRLNEILNESVTFSAAKLIKDDPRYPDGLYSSTEWEKKVEEPCYVCDGTGTEHFGEYEHEGKHYPAQDVPCRMCDGKKVIDRWIPEYPEMNISNVNAAELLKVLGVYGDELVGSVPNNQLPEFKRKLIKLKNNNSSLLADPYKDTGEMRRYKDSNGMDRIGHGVTIYHGGRTSEQVSRYIDTLITLATWAQEHGANITWA